MTTPSNPNQPQGITPEGLANQLFDLSIAQAFAENQSDPREAARRVIMFLTEALVYAISSSAGDDVARKAMLKDIGERIIAASPIPGSPGSKPPAGKP